MAKGTDLGRPDRELAFEPLADRGLFLLIDPDAPLPWPFHTASQLAGPVAETDAGVGFVSAGRDFYPSVKIRLWAAQPRVEAAEWDATGETSIVVRSGYLRLQSLMADVAGMFEVEPGRWHMRWGVRGRAEAARRAERADLFFHGTEEWLLDLWPEEAA